MQNSDECRLYFEIPQTEALGPGKRYAIWVQGCRKRCRGCISPDAQPLDSGYEKTVEDLAKEILSVPNIEGITISGGEPFLQQEPLCELIKAIRSEQNLGVIVYTGMQYDEIVDTELASLCDLIIDGEYIDELNDNKSLRGSSNQNMICVTDRYRGVVDTLYGVPGRKIEMVVDREKTNMVGIPPRR